MVFARINITGHEITGLCFGNRFVHRDVGACLASNGVLITMIIESQRFGAIELLASEVFTLHNGLPGHRSCRHFAWIQHAEDNSRAWLQSANEPALAVRLMAPMACVPGYNLTIHRDILPILAADDLQEIEAYVPLENAGHGLTAQFDRPILIHAAARCGICVSLPDMPEIKNYVAMPSASTIDHTHLVPPAWRPTSANLGGFQTTGILAARAVQ